MSKMIETLNSIEGCEVDFVAQIRTKDEGGTPYGTLKNTAFYITFAKGKYLLQTVHRGGDWMLATELLTAQCSEFMGSEPICQYDEDDPARRTVEWDLVDPEKRLHKIVNGGEEFAKLKLKDIVLFGGRELSDYEDEDAKKAFVEAEAERIKNARIYGIDPGGCDVEYIKNAADWELFIDYYSITKMAFYMNHDVSRDYSRGHVSDEKWKSTQETLAEMQYTIEYMMYAISKKIGVDVSEPEIDKHVSPDREMFMKWYRFYDNHFMNTLSEDECEELTAKRKAGEDVSEFLPVGDWREYSQE